MSGWMMDYEKYQASLKGMISPEPVVKPFRIDYKGLVKYAAEKGKTVLELSEAEKEKFFVKDVSYPE